MNEDDYLIAHLVPYPAAPRERLRRGPSAGSAYLFAVADGVGAAAATARASTIALQALRKAARTLISQLSSPAGAPISPAEALKRAVLAGHLAIEREVQKHPERAAMASTLTAALVLWPTTYVVHVGGSRCYVVRGSRLRRVTTDHTLAQRFLDLGFMAPDRPSLPQTRNLLWNVVGGGPRKPKPQLRSGRLRFGDSLLLLTDGLTNPLPDGEIGHLVRKGGRAADLTERIVQAAKAHGGADDMAVVYARFDRATMWERACEALTRKDIGESLRGALNSPLRFLRQRLFH